jgi:anthranilate phosphoribosyltransferase
VDGPAASAAIIRRILAGERGPARDIVVLNAAAGLIASGRMSDPRSAATAAEHAIDSGNAKSLLDRLVERSAAST